jgi:hypothetical protein
VGVEREQTREYSYMEKSPEKNQLWTVYNPGRLLEEGPMTIHVCCHWALNVSNVEDSK